MYIQCVSLYVGGYGYVFVAQDTQSGKEYALKRQVVAKDNIKTLKQEIAFLKQLRGHPHIIQLVGAAGSPPSHTSHGNAEFVILTELCSGGKMEDIVNSVRLSPRHVLCVFYQTCSAVAHLHSQTPPIIHRDLKVENLLLTTGGSIKLCDFGSATTEHVAPDHSWTATQRGLADDEIQQNTTPMYRSPEMIDLYSNHPICEKADIWALGCLLYKLCYREHPFEDSAKLRILSANYKLPSDDTTHLMFHSIIRACLQVNPADRPTVDSIVAQLYAMADKLRENLDQPSVSFPISPHLSSPDYVSLPYRLSFSRSPTQPLILQTPHQPSSKRPTSRQTKGTPVRSTLRYTPPASRLRKSLVS
jgi:cyclin G-associated kinase